MRKGIVLAGGTGTRLSPATKSISKQLLPVYDKPMIYYPLSILMLTGIREILIISTPSDLDLFQRLLGNGSELGLKLEYATQPEPHGVADAFRIAKPFIGNEKVALILGDNIFFGMGLSGKLNAADARDGQATIFTYPVSDPSPFGVVTFDAQRNPLEIVEKPTVPASNHAVTGLYFYDNDVVEIASQIGPSPRGQLEITDVNRVYLEQGRLVVDILGRGATWMDAGTPHALLDAANFVASVERRQGMKIACLEEIAWRSGWITTDELQALGSRLASSSYGEYLLNLAEARE